MLGLGLIVAYFGSLDYATVFKGAPALAAATLSIAGQSQWSVLTAICIGLFVGAMGKSAQVPLHVWLPDSMEGPTPISALIHAATMVTAGIFMVARMSPLYELSETARSVVLVIGALTAYQAELQTEAKSQDEMERETAKVDLAHVERLLTVFKS